MGMLEDELTEYHRMRDRDAALAACIRAMLDVQEYWSDPSSYTHNRLETPMLVHAEIIDPILRMLRGEARRALEGKE